MELKRLRIPPSPLCDNASFLRRVHLDVVGRLPAPDEIKPLLAGPASASKREQVIDRLLASPEFVDFWTLKLGDLLVINSKKLGDDGARAYHGWLRQQIAENIPLDRLVRELLTAQGDPARSGPANFHKFTTDPRDMGEFVSRALLGTRVACARCHNHPFDRWTIDDYYHPGNDQTGRRKDFLAATDPVEYQFSGASWRRSKVLPGSYVLSVVVARATGRGLQSAGVLVKEGGFGILRARLRGAHVPAG